MKKKANKFTPSHKIASNKKQNKLIVMYFYILVIGKIHLDV